MRTDRLLVVPVILASLLLNGAADRAFSQENPPAGASKNDKRLKKIEKLKKDLDIAKQRYANAQVIARNTFLNAFVKTKKAIGNNRSIQASVRSNLISTIEEERRVFENSGELPVSDMMLGDLWDYLLKVHRAMAPVLVLYNKLIEAHLSDGEQSGELTGELERFEQSLPGRKSFQPQTNWKGARTGADGASVNVDFWVGKFDGKTFKGTIWMDRGNVEMRVAGTIDGSYLDLENTQMIKGPARRLRFQGFALGDRMILSISGIATNGGKASGMLILRREVK